MLYITPTLNHYKFNKINHLAAYYTIDILSGQGIIPDNKGNVREIYFSHIDKESFNNDKSIRRFIKTNYFKYDYVIMPFEIKFFSIIIWIYYLKIRASASNHNLISYNHPVPKTQNPFSAIIAYPFTVFAYRVIYDKIIFYTEQGYKWAVSRKIVSPNKAFWANNTMDNEEVNKYYQFIYPPSNDLRILFIGRLIPSKKVDLLIDYYNALKGRFNIENRSLKLEVIGDGPDRCLIQSSATSDPDILWHGTLTEEKMIAPIIARSTVVFIPGASGLSINHAFAYGRPYITLQSKSHGPEISYLEDGKNGLILTGSFETNVEVLYNLLTDWDKIIAFCNNAREKGKQLSINNWVEQIKKALDA